MTLVQKCSALCDQSHNDGSGLWICSKRLEKGRFSWPSQGDENGKVRLSQEQLSMLVGGIELKQTRRKDWYRKEIAEVR